MNEKLMIIALAGSGGWLLRSLVGSVVSGAAKRVLLILAEITGLARWARRRAYRELFRQITDPEWLEKYQAAVRAEVETVERAIDEAGLSRSR
jgi:hypothetical protein